MNRELFDTFDSIDQSVAALNALRVMLAATHDVGGGMTQKVAYGIDTLFVRETDNLSDRVDAMRRLWGAGQAAAHDLKNVDAAGIARTMGIRQGIVEQVLWIAANIPANRMPAEEEADPPARPGLTGARDYLDRARARIVEVFDRDQDNPDVLRGYDILLEQLHVDLEACRLAIHCLVEVAGPQETPAENSEADTSGDKRTAVERALESGPAVDAASKVRRRSGTGD